MVEMEIENLGLSISDNSLSKLIKDNINFKDENNIFSRLKYEKFLLTSNMYATQFRTTILLNMSHNIQLTPIELK